MDQSANSSRKLRKLQLIVTNEHCYLAVADRHNIERWSVENRIKIDEVETVDYCKEYFGDNGKKYSIQNILIYIYNNVSEW